MNVLYLHAWDRERYNLGDDVYLQGSKILLNEALGEHKIIKGVLEDFARNVDNIKNIENLELDLIITTGAPWLYSNFHKSWQYKFLKRLNKMYPQVKKIALGLGGCSGLTKDYFTRKVALKACKETFGKFDLIFARDPMTAQFIQLSGVDCKILLDSAVFFPMKDYIKKYNLEIVHKKPVFCYFDYSKGICKGDISIEDGERINEMYKYIVKTYNPICYCVNEEEPKHAKNIGIKTKWYMSYEEILPLLAQASFIVSGRVHQATLARLLGKKVYIIPYDIRYLCTSPLGVEPLFIQPEPKLSDVPTHQFATELIHDAKEKIVKEIRKVVK